jgi:hypothetical protein
MPIVSCPHYAPTVLGNTTFICPGCACLVADPRHPQNQANGIAAATVVADPGSRTLPKSPFRKA